MSHSNSASITFPLKPGLEDVGARGGNGSCTQTGRDTFLFDNAERVGGRVESEIGRLIWPVKHKHLVGRTNGLYHILFRFFFFRFELLLQVFNLLVSRVHLFVFLLEIRVFLAQLLLVHLCLMLVFENGQSQSLFRAWKFLAQCWYLFSCLLSKQYCLLSKCCEDSFLLPQLTLKDVSFSIFFLRVLSGFVQDQSVKILVDWLQKTYLQFFEPGTDILHKTLSLLASLDERLESTLILLDFFSVVFPNLFKQLHRRPKMVLIEVLVFEIDNWRRHEVEFWVERLEEREVLSLEVLQTPMIFGHLRCKVLRKEVHSTLHFVNWLLESCERRIVNEFWKQRGIRGFVDGAELSAVSVELGRQKGHMVWEHTLWTDKSWGFPR